MLVSRSAGDPFQRAVAGAREGAAYGAAYLGSIDAPIFFFFCVKKKTKATEEKEEFGRLGGDKFRNLQAKCRSLGLPLPQAWLWLFLSCNSWQCQLNFQLPINDARDGRGADTAESLRSADS